MCRRVEVVVGKLRAETGPFVAGKRFRGGKISRAKFLGRGHDTMISMGSNWESGRPRGRAGAIYSIFQEMDLFYVQFKLQRAEEFIDMFSRGGHGDGGDKGLGEKPAEGDLKGAAVEFL